MPVSGQLVSCFPSLRLLLLPVVMATVLAPMQAQAADGSLDHSVQQLRRFPFQPDRISIATDGAGSTR